MKTLASKINQASFLLKTTEVTARLFLVVNVMMQGSGVPKACPLCPKLMPLGGTIQPPEYGKGLGWHSASFCTTCQGETFTKELYSPPALTPPAQWGRWHLYCFQRRAKTHYQNFRMTRIAPVAGNTALKCRQSWGTHVTETTTPCPCCSGITRGVNTAGAEWTPG